MAVASIEATNELRLLQPTAVMEKLYGEAEKICDRVTEMPTSQDIQVVNRSVAQRTAGEASSEKGLNNVFQKETWLTYPLYGSISFAHEYRGSIVWLC